MVHAHSSKKVLVIGYTNHALDQFIEELLDVGIPGGDMIRLGSKSTTRTAPLLMKSQRSGKRTREVWSAIDMIKKQRRAFVEQLIPATAAYLRPAGHFEEIMEHLEFSDNDQAFFGYFKVPTDDSGFKQVGKKGKAIQRDYLYDRWKQGMDPGVLHRLVSTEANAIWKMPLDTRKKYINDWTETIIRERVAAVQLPGKEIDKAQENIDELLDEANVELLRSKRVIACTTTAAAMYNKMIRAAKPDIVLVEEAGEILESHVLTALAPTVQQLILIGDHKQLPPKINTYALSIAKGDGYDLNRSLFERLIIQGVPHTTLRKQHRMHPDISLYPRALTYPELLDDPKTFMRKRVKELHSRVIFVDHLEAETNYTALVDRNDTTVKASKQNPFEATMVLKCVKYLSQQGYKTDQMVVLTPYLGQLRLLLGLLETENDPILNELDSHDLIRAGLMTQAAAKVEKRPLRLSTIGEFGLM